MAKVLLGVAVVAFLAATAPALTMEYRGGAALVFLVTLAFLAGMVASRARGFAARFRRGKPDGRR